MRDLTEYTIFGQTKENRHQEKPLARKSGPSRRAIADPPGRLLPLDYNISMEMPLAGSCIQWPFG